MGFEIQSDSINSGNRGMPNSFSSVPHDLVPAERNRLADEMLKGFRYCRLAGGLYWRGLDPEQKYLEPRWPEQLTELKALLDRAGVESLSFEYWSPPPFWKANRQYMNSKAHPDNTLRCFGHDFKNDPDYHGDVDRFLADFAEANRRNLQTLRDAGLKVGFFGLQNEPFANTGYSSCTYSYASYARTFCAVAPVVRQFDPSIKIIADTCYDAPHYIASVLKNPATANLVDLLVVHAVGADSSTVVSNLKRTRELISQPLPLYQNEYEYLDGPTSPARCLNTVQNIINWYQLAQSPTWYWIHCLKPIQNSEASGYSLGFWRPPGDTEPLPPAVSKVGDVAPGHFIWNPYNWYAVAGFLKHMPWNSTVLKVEEAKSDPDMRILAFKRPDGKEVIVVSNRSGKSFTFDIDTGLANPTFTGFRYTPTDAGEGFLGKPIGGMSGRTLKVAVADLTWEFWVEK